MRPWSALPTMPNLQPCMLQAGGGPPGETLRRRCMQFAATLAKISHASCATSWRLGRRTTGEGDVRRGVLRVCPRDGGAAGRIYNDACRRAKIAITTCAAGAAAVSAGGPARAPARTASASRCQNSGRCPRGNVGARSGYNAEPLRAPRVNVIPRFPVTRGSGRASTFTRCALVNSVTWIAGHAAVLGIANPCNAACLCTEDAPRRASPEAPPAPPCRHMLQAVLRRVNS